MSLPLYERVALKRDLPEHDLRRGDVVVLVDYVPHPEGGEEGCVLEVFNALGESIAAGVPFRGLFSTSRAFMPGRRCGDRYRIGPSIPERTSGMSN